MPGHCASASLLANDFSATRAREYAAVCEAIRGSNCLGIIESDDHGFVRLSDMQWAHQGRRKFDVMHRCYTSRQRCWSPGPCDTFLVDPSDGTSTLTLQLNSDNQ